MENLTVTDKEKAFLVHNRILANGQIIAGALFEVCRDLKTMRDDGLYSQLGYKTFEEYSENACKIKQRQAYSYISAYEKLGENFIRENSGWGITKLELISQISSYERDEFLDNNDIDDLSVRKLKKQVEEYKNQVEQLSFDFENSKKENGELLQQLSDMQKDTEDIPLTAFVEPDREVIDAAVSQALEEERLSSKNIIDDLKAKLKAQKDKVKEITDSKAAEIKEAEKRVAETANKRIDALIAEKNESDEKLRRAVKSARAANADEDVTAIRFLFTDLQSTAKEIKNHLDKIFSKDAEQAGKLSAVMINTLESIADSLNKG